ncbi:MAG: toxin-activating lysine-acyltransferase [Pseudomonadota bacterium]
MFFDTAQLDVIAPGLIAQPWNEVEVLGSATWLWMHSRLHQNLPIKTLSALLLPALKHRQFILASEAGRPVFYLAWANLNLEAEERYLKDHPVHMQHEDWNSGERGWILDWIAPFGHTQVMSRLLTRQLFANRFMRHLYHRGHELDSAGLKRGLTVKEFCGRAVLPQASREWFATHPIATTPTSHRHTLTHRDFS